MNLSLLWSYVQNNPSMDAWVLAGVLGVLYTLWGKASNVRLHAMFELATSLGLNAPGVARAITMLLTGKLPADPSAMQAPVPAVAPGPAAASVSNETVALENSLKGSN